MKGLIGLQTRTSTSKIAKATAIFAECLALPKMPARKDILVRFQNEAGCTKKCSATYLQVLKNRHGLANNIR